MRQERASPRGAPALAGRRAGGGRGLRAGRRYQMRPLFSAGCTIASPSRQPQASRNSFRFDIGPLTRQCAGACRFVGDCCELANLQKALAGPTADAARKPVADADFQKFLASVKKEAFDEGKLALVKDFARGNYFTSSQAAVVVKLFAFSDGQVQSAVTLHPRLTDPSNFFEVLGVFTFDADKAKVRGALKMK